MTEIKFSIIGDLNSTKVLTADLAQFSPTVPEITHLCEAKAARRKNVVVESWVTPSAMPSKKSWILRAKTIINPLAVA